MNKLDQKLEKMLAELDTISHKDRPIDRPIKRVVALMNLLGFPTFFSCGGHCGKKKIVIPYVMGKEIGKPDHRFTKERKIIDRIAKKHKVRFGDVYHLGFIQTRFEKEFLDDVVRLHLKETRRYEIWHEKNKTLAKKLEKITRSFNHTRKNIPHKYKLQVDTLNDCYRLQFCGEDAWFNTLTKTGYNQKDRRIWLNRLHILRKEIKALEHFLGRLVIVQK